MSLIDGLRVAMLGTTDGDFIDPDSDIPAGEMFRLAAEYVEGVEKRLVAAWYRGMAIGDNGFIVNDEKIDDAMSDLWAALNPPALSDDAVPGGV